MKNRTTINRKRPRSIFSGLLVSNFPMHRLLYWCSALVVVMPSHMTVEAFGIITSPNPSVKVATRDKTSLSASTLTPPPDHMAWLQAQDEIEKCLKKHTNLQPTYQVKQAEQPEVAPLKIPEQTTLCIVNATAKEAWAASFTTVEALRETFGRNKNPLWGDLDCQTTRSLYKTVLQRALLELDRCHGATSKDLAPLAYRARVAAKKYARERSVLPARIAATLFDGFRQFRKSGKFQATGMSYPQLWEKYAIQIMQEEGLDDKQDFVSAVCSKIVQKFSETNKRVDQLFSSLK